MFPLGWIVATPAALEALQAAGMDGSALLPRHRHGDWGEINSEDMGLNEVALRTGGRLLSVYPLRMGETLWILTEADRSVTTLLLPHDY